MYTEGALKLMEAGEDQLQEWRDEVFRLLDLADERAEGASNEEAMAASLDSTAYALKELPNKTQYVQLEDNKINRFFSSVFNSSTFTPFSAAYLIMPRISRCALGTIGSRIWSKDLIYLLYFFVCPFIIVNLPLQKPQRND